MVFPGGHICTMFFYFRACIQLGGVRFVYVLRKYIRYVCKTNPSSIATVVRAP